MVCYRRSNNSGSKCVRRSSYLNEFGFELTTLNVTVFLVGAELSSLYFRAPTMLSGLNNLSKID